MFLWNYGVCEKGLRRGFTSVHTVNVYRGGGGIALFILNLGTGSARRESGDIYVTYVTYVTHEQNEKKCSKFCLFEEYVYIWILSCVYQMTYYIWPNLACTR